MNYETIAVEREGALVRLRLNRPERLNAMNPRMCEELLHCFGRLQSDLSARVLLLQGAGASFCAGYDLHDAQGVSAGAGTIASLNAQRQISEVILRMRRCPQPIICLLQGAATGGGLALALASDVRIAAQGARMNVAMIKVGLSGCDVGISYFLPRAVGSSVAAELMMTGRFLGADRALAIGLVSELVEPAALEEAGLRMARDMLKTSPLGLRLTKEGIGLNATCASLEAAIAMEDRGQVLCASAGLMKEGIAAFVERRDANFSDGA